MTPGDATLLYELRVQLKAVDPPVWRLLQVRWDTTLHHLHEVLQVAMGWTNSHLYLFHVGDTVYGEPSSEWDTIVRDSTRVKLETIFSESGGSFLYEYDLGDSWMHAITLEGTLDVKGEEMAWCAGGARACPPEDCGGPPGYEHVLEAISDPHHQEHGAMLDWVGGGFEPEEFDVQAADSALSRLA